LVGGFARFVRRGFNRVDVAGTTPPSRVSVIAFQSPTDNTVAIVAINTGRATTVPIFVQGTAWPASVVSWTTSSSADLTSGGPPR
jgi:O-glycosyl hydrolase